MIDLQGLAARFNLGKLKEEPAIGLGLIGVLATVKDRSIHLLALAGVAWWIYTPPPRTPLAVDDEAAAKLAAAKDVQAAARQGATKEDLVRIWNAAMSDAGIARAEAPAPASKPQLLDARAAVFDGSDDKALLAKG